MSTSGDEESRRATCNRPQRGGDAGAGRCSDVPSGWRAGEQDAVTKARSSLSALTAVLLQVCACTHPKAGSGGPPNGTPVLPPSSTASPAEARAAPVSPFQVVATGADDVKLVPAGASVLLMRKFPFAWLTAGQLKMDPLLAWDYPRALGESTVDVWQGRLELLALGGSPDALWAGFMEGSGVAVPDEATFRWTRRQGWRVVFRTRPWRLSRTRWTDDGRVGDRDVRDPGDAPHVHHRLHHSRCDVHFQRGRVGPDRPRWRTSTCLQIDCQRGASHGFSAPSCSGHGLAIPARRLRLHRLRNRRAHEPPDHVREARRWSPPPRREGRRIGSDSSPPSPRRAV